MFRVGVSASLHRVPQSWGVRFSTLRRPLNTSIRALSTTSNSNSRFSYQQQQQHHHKQQQQHGQHGQSSWSSSRSSRILLSSTAALVAATGITTLLHEPAHAAPLTHNHPHNPIVLTAPKELPNEVIGADLVVASRWRRVVARLLDSMIQGFICQAGAFIGIPYNAVALVVSIAYELLLNVYNDGQTFGKMMTRIRTVKDSGDSVDLQAAFLNWFGFAFFTLLAGADALWSVFNLSGDYKCLHNVISGTIVVDTSSLAAEEKHAALARWKHRMVDVELEDEDDD